MTGAPTQRQQDYFDHLHDTLKPCRFCAGLHPFMCPFVAVATFHLNGTLAKVEMREAFLREYRDQIIAEPTDIPEDSIPAEWQKGTA